MLVHDWPFLQWDDCFGCRWPVAQGPVRAFGFIVLAPLLDDDLGLLQWIEDFTVEQLIPETGIEAFDIAVFPG